MTRRTPIVWGALAVLCGGCDLGAYPDLLEPLDPFIGLNSRDHATYVAANGETSVFLVFAGPDADQRRFTRTFYRSDGSAVLLGGTYRFEGDQLFLQAEQRFEREPNGIPFGDRQGSRRSESSERLVYRFEPAEGEIFLTNDRDERRRYINFDRVLERASEYSAVTLARLFNAQQVSAQARVVGFGTTAMIEYATPADFGGSLTGSFNVSLRDLFNPTTTFRYEEFSDFSGLQFDGEQLTRTDFSGNGYSYGVVTMTLTPANGLPTTTIDVDYGEADGSSGLQIVDGEGGGGFYVLTVNGESAEVGWQDFEDRDLSDLLTPFETDSPVR